MALETADYIDELVDTNPPGGDQLSSADDHIRLLKSVLQSTFPNLSGAMTATEDELNLLDDAVVTTDQINYLADVSASVQDQLNAKVGISATAMDSHLLADNSAGYYLSLGNATGSINDSQHGNRGGGNLHSNATAGTAGFMSSSDKSKLNGIESGATADQTASEILNLLLGVDGASSGLDAQYLAGQNAAFYRALGNATGSINDSQHGSRGGGTLHNVATTGSNGFMSSNDKSKLNGIESGATADQSVGEIQAFVSSGHVQSVMNDAAHGARSGGALHSTATTGAHGFMSSSDKTKLNGIESGATQDQTPAEIQEIVSAGYVQSRASAGYVQSVLTNFHNIQAFTSSDSISLPGTVTTIAIHGGAGGGGGGGNNDANEAGGGGGAGAQVVTFLSVTPGSTLTITIGSGGSGGGQTADGQDGGDTTITGDGVSYTINGGSGGDGGWTGPAGAGGAGGAASLSAGLMACPGDAGGDGVSSSAGGAGGDAFFLFSRGVGGAPGSNDGGDATGFCAGGGGAFNQGSGGDGAPGYLVIAY